MTDPLTPKARALCDAMSAAFPPPGDPEALRAAARAGVRPPAPSSVTARDGVAAGVRVRVYTTTAGGRGHGGGPGTADEPGRTASASTSEARTDAAPTPDRGPSPDGSRRAGRPRGEPTRTPGRADGGPPLDPVAHVGRPLPGATAHDGRCPGPGAASPPVVVLAHGGGWVLCDLDTHDGLCRALVERSGATVVSVDYRRAPEHRFPAAEDDVHTVLTWAAGAYPGRVLVVAGDSSGGNLAAAVALRARDGDGPALAGQLLFYPVLDHRLDGVSAEAYAEGFFHTAAHMRWYWEQYLGPHGDPVAASPGLAADLTGLPPALVVLADCDPLRDEGLAYARRLSAAGVTAEVRLHTGMFHGFLGARGILPEADKALDGAAAWLSTLTG
ncbi:alpha/beta hydrolase fold domain-containing protein [Streptomyces sp. HUAS MG47]|uniref:alpha/beta hydrolase n=1 Tax=Streptomyces solicamelliae TaxID=3231716 RepID=UPI0038783C91